MQTFPVHLRAQQTLIDRLTKHEAGKLWVPPPRPMSAPALRLPRPRCCLPVMCVKRRGDWWRRCVCRPFFTAAAQRRKGDGCKGVGSATADKTRCPVRASVLPTPVTLLCIYSAHPLPLPRWPPAPRSWRDTSPASARREALTATLRMSCIWLGLAPLQLRAMDGTALHELAPAPLPHTAAGDASLLS